MICSQNDAKRHHYLLLHHFGSFLPANVIQKLQLRGFSDGEYLCREGEIAGFLFFLVEGHCRVTRFLGNGKESLTCFYHSFAILGDLELILNVSMETAAGPEDRRAAASADTLAVNNNVQAVGPVWCLCLPLADARDLVMTDMTFLRFLCGHLCQKLNHSNYNLAISLNYPVDERLASYICCASRGNLFQDNYTHLAEYLGCSHRQLLRVLRRFCEEGILEKRQRSYWILDEERLKKLAGDIYRL